MSIAVNPFSTGGGGGNFENKIQASFLALMLTEGPCPCLPSGAVQSIRFQARQAGYNIDDIVLTVTSTEGLSYRLLSQIKHQIAFTQGNDEFRETLVAAWKDFGQPELFNPQHDAIAIITGPASSKTTQHVKPILEWARTSASEVEFFSKVATPNFSSKDKRDFIFGVQAILSQSEKPPRDDGELWRFLKTLHVLAYDFDVARGQYEALTLAILNLTLVPDSGLSAESLWAQLLNAVRTANQNAATILRSNLDLFLPAESLRAIRQPLGRATGGTVDRLSSHTAQVLHRISDEFAAGTKLDRTSLVDKVLEPFRKVVESGESDVIHCRAPETKEGARCGSPNIAARRSAAVCAIPAI